ncbi:MAG: hypothetical protein RIS94_2292 [Pseudomonadota bacterium]|jgi:uncharacterized protein (DUF885 family)
MKRRDFLATGSALGVGGLLTGLGWPLEVLAQTAGDARLAATFERIFAESLRLSPENATGLGLDKGALAPLRGKLDDRTATGRAATVAFNRRALAAVKAVDPASLSPAVARQREVVAYRFEQALGGVPFGIDSVERPYPINQQQGAYFDIPDFLDSRHPVETGADAEAYLSRLAAFAGALDAETRFQRSEAARGVVAPGWSIDLALGQMEKLRSGAPEQSGLAQSLARRAAAKGLAGDWQGRAGRIVSQMVYPALDRQIALMKALRATTPAGDGAWRMKQGEAIYAAALREATTTTMTPEEVHKTGLDQVSEISAQLDGILTKAGFTSGTVGQRLAQLNTSPEQLYPDSAEGRAALIASLNRGIAAMQGNLPRAFNDVPHEALEIRAVPAEIQDGAPNGYYYSPALDGSRPAIYWINLKQVGDWPKYSLPALTYHEGIPGHHLQGGYARSGAALPMLLKDYFISAYGEGWALYAEQLGDELGGYTGIERAGYLQSFLFRAVRLVVDTGIHHYRWSREQATDYMVEKTGFTRARSQREIERYCTMIGQACSYKIGHTAWIKARARAEAALGDKFSLPWFHDVLKEGSMPLFMLEKRIAERTRERLAQA